MARRPALSASQAELRLAEGRSPTFLPALCFQRLTTVKLCNSFILMTIRIARRGYTPHPLFADHSSERCLSPRNLSELCNRCVEKTPHHSPGRPTRASLLESTLARPPVSVHFKGLTQELNPLESTLPRNRGREAVMVNQESEAVSVPNFCAKTNDEKQSLLFGLSWDGCLCLSLLKLRTYTL